MSERRLTHDSHWFRVWVVITLLVYLELDFEILSFVHFDIYVFSDYLIT